MTARSGCRRSAKSPARPRAMSPPRAPGLLLGLGLGGFIDGIVLHQILQWHHMLTSTSEYPMSTVAGLEANTLADGFFHVATWIFVAAGSFLTVRSGEPGGSRRPGARTSEPCCSAGARSTSSRA